MLCNAHCVLVSILIGSGGFATLGDEPQATAPTNGAALMRINIPGIHNAFQVTDRVYSGSQPEGDESFAALAQLGISTIISVDGSRPDVDTARNHGLRYIHLPFGYDGVPANRVAELARAAGSHSGPVYVHCHHGLHRGPAAVAVICEATENWPPNRAVAWMREAGTGTDYSGLYHSALAFKKPTIAQLAAIENLPEVSTPSSLVEVMVTIDEHFSRLKHAQKVGWNTPPGQADVAPAHEAKMLWEQFREMARTEDTARRPVDYRTKLAEAQRSSEAFHKRLQDTSDVAFFDTSFKQVEQSCTACHKLYRNE